MPSPTKLRVLVLGGSSEATALAAILAAVEDIQATLSLAGRTRAPIAQPLPTRTGGFGGIDGLVAYLRTAEIDLLVDATHPFAEQISRHADAAARSLDLPLIRVGRAPWRPAPGDRWQEVASMEDAAEALGATPLRVFLTVGRLRLGAFTRAPQHHYLIRSIDPIGDAHGLPNVEPLERRGPFDADAEERLLRERRIDVLVTKNSGGDAAFAKLEAARRLGLPAILVRRPPDAGPTISVAEAAAAIARLGRPEDRGT